MSITDIIVIRHFLNKKRHTSWYGVFQSHASKRYLAHQIYYYLILATGVPFKASLTKYAMYFTKFSIFISTLAFSSVFI